AFTTQYFPGLDVGPRHCHELEELSAMSTTPSRERLRMSKREPLTVPDGAVFVDGDWEHPIGESIPVENPATEEVIGSVPESDADICARAVLAARLALPTWSTLAARDRVQYLYALADEFEVHGEQLARLATQEIGMPITESRATQVKLPV